MDQPAIAEGLIYELKAGVLDHDVPNLWSGFRRETNTADINIEAQLSPSMQAFFGTIRPAVGASISTDGQTSHAYIDARWTIEASSGLFFATGLGGAIHDGSTDNNDATRKALGSRILFHIPIELGYRFDAHNSVSGYFEHTSNAYTMRYNQGLDRLGIRYGYRF
jgi:lipid A 3-O-deacylase